jgi:hypothetical protein
VACVAPHARGSAVCRISNGDRSGAGSAPPWGSGEFADFMKQGDQGGEGLSGGSVGVELEVGLGQSASILASSSASRAFSLHGLRPSSSTATRFLSRLLGLAPQLSELAVELFHLQLVRDLPLLVFSPELLRGVQRTQHCDQKPKPRSARRSASRSARSRSVEPPRRPMPRSAFTGDRSTGTIRIEPSASTNHSGRCDGPRENRARMEAGIIVSRRPTSASINHCLQDNDILKKIKLIRRAPHVSGGGVNGLCSGRCWAISSGIGRWPAREWRCTAAGCGRDCRRPHHAGDELQLSLTHSLSLFIQNETSFGSKRALQVHRRKSTFLALGRKY